MRPQVFVPLLVAMVLGIGVVALSARALDRTDIGIHRSTLRFERGGTRLKFQLFASGFRGGNAGNLPVIVRLRWAGENRRILEGAPTLDFEALATLERLPALLVFDSDNFPDVRNFLRPREVPVAARHLEIIVDATHNYPDELDEGNNRYHLARPLPDLTLTNAQALADEDTAWFVLRNRTVVPVVQPIVADLTWLGRVGTELVPLAGPYTWTVWPGPEVFVDQTPLVQMWGEGRSNTGVIAPPIFPRPAGAVALKFDLNPLAPADAGVTPIPETNRDNNTATVPVAPDLIARDARIIDGTSARFTIRTVRGPSAVGPVQMLFQWVTSTGTPTGTPVRWVFNRAGGVFPRLFGYNTRRQRGFTPLFETIPTDATHLRLTVNPSEGSLEFPPLVEFSTANNTTDVPRP